MVRVKTNQPKKSRTKSPRLFRVRDHFPRCLHIAALNVRNVHSENDNRATDTLTFLRLSLQTFCEMKSIQSEHTF